MFIRYNNIVHQIKAEEHGSCWLGTHLGFGVLRGLCLPVLQPRCQAFGVSRLRRVRRWLRAMPSQRQTGPRRVQSHLELKESWNLRKNQGKFRKDLDVFRVHVWKVSFSPHLHLLTFIASGTFCWYFEIEGRQFIPKNHSCKVFGCGKLVFLWGKAALGLLPSWLADLVRHFEELVGREWHGTPEACELVLNNWKIDPKDTWKGFCECR